MVHQLVQRQAALAGVALLATLGALALDRRQDEPLPSAPDPTSVTGQPWSAVYDAYYNAQFARHLYDNSGWQPWACRP